LANIEFPSSLTTIGDHAFSYCKSLTSIELPASVTEIGSYAFAWCSSIKSIKLPASTTTIANSLFIYCTSLESIELPESLTSIGGGAFDHCSSLQSIELPASVTAIGNSAFSSCSSLTSIELPSSLTSIGDQAFAMCYLLEKIELPSTVTSIGVDAFLSDTSLQEISVSESNENYTSIDGVLYDKNVSTLIRCPGGKSDKLTVPSSVTSIGDRAFGACSSLQEISVSESNENYTSIDGVLYSKNVSTLICFPGGKSGEFIVPSSVTSIGNNAFYECKTLVSIELPASLTEICNRAFGFCKSLKIVTSLNPVPPTLGSNVFYSCPVETVYVPTESIETYQVADGWKKFNIVGIGTSGIEDAIFRGDAVESATVYTLQGVRVKGVSTMNDVKSLTPGLYIVNGKNVFVK
jgi:hypothetical protein